MSDPLAAQYTLLKVPSEVLNQGFKRCRKDTEKQMNQILSSFISLKNRESISQSEALETLESSRARLTNLKRKLTDDYLKQNSIHDDLRKRIQHISVSSIDQASYIKTKINRQIVEHFSLKKRFEQAEELGKLLKVSEFCACERQLIKTLYGITTAIQQKQLGPVIKWCAQNKAKLNQNQSNLQFKLTIMQYVELIRAKKKLEAVELLRDQNLQITQKNKEEFQKAIGCLVFADHLLDFPAYGYFFSQDRWKELIEMFKSACYIIYKLRFESNLQKTLSVGISIIKTSSCSPSGHKVVCPICQSNFNALSSQIPYTMKDFSTLICRVTKQRMTESNPPVMLPNGQIFCHNAMQLLQKNGKIRCPITETYYEKSSVRRIYII